MESFDILLTVFFVFFTIWLTVIIFKAYNYIMKSWKVVCLICNVPEEVQYMYRCRTNSSHKFHKSCFEKIQYNCPSCTNTTITEQV